MSLKRMLRHLCLPPWTVRRAFPAAALQAIEEAIRQSETRHSGQIRFAVESALDWQALRHDQAPESRARDVFSQLRIWDTEHNNGVLIYLLLADRHVEIVADRGVHAQVGTAGWEAICRLMETAFRESRFEAGVLDGIRAVTDILARAYPPSARQPDELPNRPVVV